MPESPVNQREESLQISSPEGVRAIDGSVACPVQRRGRLKGMLPMAICCAAPLLVALAIPLFGIAPAVVGGSLLSLVAVLACPLGIYFMIRMMANNT